MPLIHLQEAWTWTRIKFIFVLNCSDIRVCQNSPWSGGLFLETRLLYRNKEVISKNFEPKISCTVLLELFGAGPVWCNPCIDDSDRPLGAKLLPVGAALQMHFNRGKKSPVNSGNVHGGRMGPWWCCITCSFIVTKNSAAHFSSSECSEFFKKCWVSISLKTLCLVQVPEIRHPGNV